MPIHATEGQKATPTEAEVTGRLQPNEVFEVLTAERRRRAIALLADAGPMTQGALADRMARQEFGLQFSSQERKRVYVALHQNHIPKLSAYGAITQDRDSIALTERGRTLRNVAAMVERELESSWRSSVPFL